MLGTKSRPFRGRWFYTKLQGLSTLACFQQNFDYESSAIHTPPETGGDKEHYKALFICNGKLVKGVYSTFEKELFLRFVYFLYPREPCSIH